jgi:hypothetical protein
MAFCPHAEDFDKDRQEILDRLDACIAPRKQLHELEWELLRGGPGPAEGADSRIDSAQCNAWGLYIYLSC